MAFSVDIFEEEFPIAGSFVISRGAKTSARVIRVVIGDGNRRGHGECVPYARYGESLASVVAQIEAVKSDLIRGLNRHELGMAMPAGAARNAVDCALWDLEAKSSGVSAFQAAGIKLPKPVITAFTLSMGTPQSMAEAAKTASHRPLLKIKVGGPGDMDRLRAVRGAAPNSKIIVDANEGWTADNLVENLALCAQLGVTMVEQPLPSDQDQMLALVDHPVLVFADESVHQSDDLAILKDRYDGVNIKLDKAGGLSEALKMNDLAKQTGLQIMIGCMVGSSLGMAPALTIAQGADFVDLDGPLLLARDREPGLRYEGSLVHPPERTLWG
jgi:L-alanine-DL-glutamate epimerase-like enolase superfamily enzyme